MLCRFVAVKGLLEFGRRDMMILLARPAGKFLPWEFLVAAG
jgi:hypothetical protein